MFLTIFWQAILIFMQTFSAPAEAIRCFQCQDYLSPTLCSDITTCAEDEYCYVEEYITTSGHVVYDSGCRTKDWCSSSVRYFGLLGKRQMDMRINDILVCSECCHGDFCNKEGCNVKVVDRDQRGPYCFDCDFMSSPDGCDSVTMCPKDQQCSLYVPQDFHYFPTLLYGAGCQTNETCEALAYDNGHGVCPPTCCNDDFCNTACGTSHTPTTSSSTTTISTPTTSISTTATTTTSTPSTTTVTYRCGMDGYEKIPHSHGVCIKIVNHEVTWSQARMICRGDHADLLVLDTNEKIHEVMEYLKHHHAHHDKFWIGLYDQFNNNTFFWVDGQPVSNTASNWMGEKHEPGHEGHPGPGHKDDHGEDCVRMEKPEHFEWKNVRCDDLHHISFICERKS